CANAFERSLPTVVTPMAAHGWLKCWDARDDATASPVSCAQSVSLHVSVPSIVWLQPTVAMVDQLRLTDLKVSSSNGLIKFGRPTRPAFSPAKGGCILSPSWMSLPAA